MTERTELQPLGSTAGLGSHARREIGHWLNELPTRDVDRRALAELCADYDALEAELYVWRQMGRSLHDAGLRTVDVPNGNA